MIFALRTLALALLVACGGAEVKFPTTPYQGAGHERFFLAELPAWANGSISAGCARGLSVRYLDYAALAKTHALDYRQRVELQTQFNLKWRERFSGSQSPGLSPQEEMVFFMETLGQVKGGQRHHRFPENVPTQVVWWDGWRARPDAAAWLTRLADRGDAVVLVSLCEASDAIQTWLEEKKLVELGLFTLGAEALNPQRPDDSDAHGPVIPLAAFFSAKNTTIWKRGELPYPAEFPAGLPVKNVEE